MRLQRLASQLLLLLLLQAVVYAHLATSLSRNIPCTTDELQQGDELLQCSRNATAQCSRIMRVDRATKNGRVERETNLNNHDDSGGHVGSSERGSTSKHNCSVTDEKGNPSGPLEFSTPWNQHLASCRGVPGQQVLLLQQMGVNRLAPVLLRFFGFLHSALHLPVLLKRLKSVHHGVSNDGEGRGSGSDGWWSLGLEWDAAGPLLRYFLSFLPFLLLLLSSLLLLLTSRSSSSSGIVAAATETAKTVSQARGSNSDAAYAALLLLLPASCSKESKHSGKRDVMLLLLIVATAAVAATLAATAADSLKAAGCEAPLAFEAFSGQQQEQQQGPRVQRGLSGILEGLQQLPKDWDSTAPAAVAAARGYTIGYPTAPDATRGVPAALTASPDLEVMLQEGATAAKQLTKSWLGSQYLLMLQTEPKVPPQQHPLLQGETLWRRSKRFLSSLLPSCRLDRCKDNTDSTSESSNEVSLDASSKGNGSAYGASEHYFFTPIQVHGRNGLDATQLQKEKQQLGVPSGKQQQGLLRCIGAEKLAVAAAAVGDALDSALKQHALLQDFVDGSLEPHQVLHQKKQLLELQQHVEEALQYGLPELWKFVRLLLQASSSGVEELLRQMPLLLLAAAIMAATAAGASFVRHLASEQPVGKLYAACSSWWRALGACCCVVASLLLLAAAVSADSTNLLKSLLQDPTVSSGLGQEAMPRQRLLLSPSTTSHSQLNFRVDGYGSGMGAQMLPRYFPLGNRALEEMLLRSMQEHQDSREGRLQQNRAALLPIPKTKELEQLVETLTSRSSPSRALWDSISMLQLHLEGHAASDWVYYPAPSLPGFRISLSTSNESSVSDAVGYQELLFELRKLTGVNWAFRWGPLPKGCVKPEPFQKPRAAAAASAAATAAAAAARAAARAIQKQLSRLLPPRRNKQQQTRLLQQPAAPCYFVSQDIEDKHLLSRFGPLVPLKSTARLLSIFSLARRVDAAHAFIEERNKADMLLLQQTAAGIEAMELLMQRSLAVAELLRPLAHQQRQLEQGNNALEVRSSIAAAAATTTTGFVLCCYSCFVLLLLVVAAFSLARFYRRRYETLLLLGALRECEARRVQQLQEDLCFVAFSRGRSEELCHSK